MDNFTILEEDEGLAEEEEESRVDVMSADVSADDAGYHAQSDGENEQDGTPQQPGSRPATAGARVLSGGLSKARLLRSRASDPSIKSYLDSDDEDDEKGNILITEIRGDRGTTAPSALEEGRITPLRRPPSQRKTRTAPLPLDDQDEDLWDTDLDIDDSLEEHDPTGRTTYMETCEKLGIVPVSYFSRHITEPEITMRYHGLGSQGSRALARVLRDSLTLEKLNLCGNYIEGEGGLYMARMLLDNDYISDLCLSENRLGALGAYHICKMLIINTGLRKLDLSGNDIGDDEAEYLAEAMEKNQFLKELNLSHNNFGVRGGEILGPAIGANDIMESIDLSWNKLRCQGAIAVARGLKENVRLKRCNLAWNGFGPEGGAAIADAIGNNQALLELDISGNRLDYETAVAVGKSLRKNEELEIFRIGNNPITTAGCISIITALNDNDGSIIHTADFTGIPVEFEFLRLVQEVKAKRDYEFKVEYGAVLRSGNTPQDIGKPSVDPYPKNPLLILREHIVVNDFRIIELIQKADVEGTLSVTPDQFAAALGELGVPFTRDQLEDVAKKLDKNDDGRIYYGDFLEQKQAIEKAKDENTDNISSRKASLQIESESTMMTSQTLSYKNEASSRRSSATSVKSNKQPVSSQDSKDMLVSSSNSLKTRPTSRKQSATNSERSKSPDDECPVHDNKADSLKQNDNIAYKTVITVE